MTARASPPGSGQPPGSPRTRRTRAAILAGAGRLFLSRGFADTSMDQVAADAQVSKQTIYAHFHGKEALFLEMARAMIDAAVTAQAARAPDPDLEADIESFLVTYGRAQIATALDHGLMQLRRLAISEHQRFPEFGAAVFHAGPGGAIARLTRIIADWHRAGRLNAADAGRAAATFNWLLMGGPTSEAMLLGQARFGGRADTEAHVIEAARVFLAAYRSD